MILEQCGNCGKEGEWREFRHKLCGPCRGKAVLVVEDEAHAAIKKAGLVREAFDRAVTEEDRMLLELEFGSTGGEVSVTFEQVRAIYFAGVRAGATDASGALRQLFWNKGVIEG